MTRAVFAVPGDLATPTGGYAYDRRMVEGLKALGWQVDVLDLGDGFPVVDDARKKRAGMLLAGAPNAAALIVDGLALGVLPEAAARLKASHRVVALVHHPLAYESGLAEPAKKALRVSEQEALSHVKGIVTTSDTTKALLVSDYSVPANAIAVVRPGNEKRRAARGGKGRLSLLAVGSIVPRKGYDVLVAALATLKDLNWTLTIAGDRERDVLAARRLDAQVSAEGLGDHITVAGAVADDKLDELYSGADVFVLASRFEGYGMALADAVAYGLPVIATNAGAIPEAVAADASILVPPDDVASLAASLRRVMGDSAEREKLAANARAAASRLPAWQDQAKLFAQAIESFA